MRSWIVLVMLLVAAPASAQNWYGRADCTGPVVKQLNRAHRGAFYCLSGAATTDSDLLLTFACGDVTVQHLKTVSTDVSTFFVRSCDGDTDLLASGKSFCHKILMDFNGGGVDDQPLNGDVGGNEDGADPKENRGIMWGFGPIDNIYLDTVTAPTTGSTRVKVTCHGAR